jgi:hypothetical protein
MVIAGTQAPTIVVDGNEWWEVALVGVLSALLGSLVTGWVAWRVSDRQAQDQARVLRGQWAQQQNFDRARWLREARARIFLGVLHEVHDWVNDAVMDMKGTQEPQSYPVRWTVDGRTERLGDRYSDLHREAMAASSVDAAMVYPFWAEWIAIGEVANQWTAAKETAGVDVASITRSYYERQLVHWENANQILNDYNEFLMADLGGDGGIAGRW